jgi:NAD-dependent dihydropyrimidine dehydrogenase PreA subunit
MVIQVNKELCTGCGVCLESCSAGAIQLVDQQAVIDDALCTQCKTCIEACPNEAITTLSRPVRNAPGAPLPVTEASQVFSGQLAVLPETAAASRGLAVPVRAALTFLGSEVAPRLIDVLVAALERKLAQPPTTAISASSISSRGLITQGRGKQRQARYRGWRTGNRYHKGRR